MEARGRVLLKIMGIIMIVGGALSIIMSIMQQLQFYPDIREPAD